MSFYRGMTCENATIKGDKGTPITAYVATPWHRPLYRPEQTMDGWSKVFAFFAKHLAK